MKRKNHEAQKLELDYLSRLREALTGIPDKDVDEIIQEVHRHIEDAVSELPEEEVTLSQMAGVLEILGPPESFAEKSYTEDAAQLAVTPTGFFGKIPRKITAAAVIVIIIISAGALCWSIYSHQSIKQSSMLSEQPPVEALKVGPKTIAVLPFEDLSPDKDQGYFVDGLSDEIISNISKIQGLKVTSSTASFSYKGSHKSIKEIASLLSVDHILMGSVRKSGNTLRITVQLIKTDDGSHIWSETYDRELKDVFAIQENIATKIADLLKLKFQKTELEQKQVLQGELAKTIRREFDSIDHARVNIVTSGDSIFAEELASVVVGLYPGKSLTTRQMQEIRNLVSGSVEGLKQENVSVVVTTRDPIIQGVTMWETGEDGLEFVVFSSMSKGQSVDSNSFDFSFYQAGSTESGHSVRVTWSVDFTSIKISEHEYSFANGRVFIILAIGSNLEIQQLDIPIRKTGYYDIQGEILRLSNIPQVKNNFD